MGQIILASIGGPIIAAIVVVVLVVAAIVYRLYLVRQQGSMRAKCSKCGNVFDASRSFSLLHFGTLKQLKCPACGKVSFMSTYEKDLITWPSQNGKQEGHGQPKGSDEEEEKMRIEESKYERS